MAEVLTVLEHDSVPISPSKTDGRRGLGRKHADLLEKLEKKLPARAWEWGNKEIKFASYCGVISLGDLSIEILPKVYGNEEENVGSSRKALIHMLLKARRLKLHKVGTAEVSSQKRNLLDIFILHFCKRLRMQLTRGMIRKYIRREKNLNVLRGKLRVEQQLRRNLVHQERLFCQYDELSADNAYNQILKYVLGMLLKMATGNRALQQVSELRARFELVSDSTVDVSTLDSLSFDRLTERYKPVFDQCGDFLRGFYPDVVAGEKNCFSLLFDMNRLFEAYIASDLRRDARIRYLRVREQESSEHFARLENPEQDIFRMIPDISFIDQENQIVMIADTKWKMLDEGKKNLGISQADMYQMGSYASGYRIKSLVLLYPLQKKLTKPVCMTLKGTGAKLLVQPVDISGHSPAWARAILSFLSRSSLSEASAS